MKPIALAACLFLLLSCLSTASALPDIQIIMTANLPIPIMIQYSQVCRDCQPIGGSGKTPFIIEARSYRGAMTLTAPAAVAWEGRTYLFSGWNTVDSYFASCNRAQGFQPTIDTAYAAYYTLAGDVTRDGRVNLLDLIKVRNRMLTGGGDEHCGEYDANRDGAVNVLDLIYIRNHLGSKAPDAE
ncbi:MAG TPA: dockerin type I domain-containing protein [Phycisphaerae bacterium]|nr:dockerin type I domain-containing protein [Phycisphaerae bacterium]